ncbi:MAG: adenylate cyclase [Fibrella sp.]|nr:adenylate cyclase [Armatimonadota bacterium]
MRSINPLVPYHFIRAGWAFRHLRAANPATYRINNDEMIDPLRRYQDERAGRIVAYAARHSPFYRRHWDGYDLGDWCNLPVVDKATMMANFDTFNTRGVSREEAFAVALRAERERDFAPTVRGNLTVGLSSGTSGHRGAFLVSPTETAAWAGTILQRVLHQLPRSGYRVAFFLRSNSNLYEQVDGRVRFRWFDLMTPTLEAVSTLNVYAPDLLIGPPSLLLALAEMSKRGMLTIRPERLVSVAETLEAQDKSELESTFGVPVGQVYQCTEGFLAATCLYGRLHINEDLVAIQYERLGENITPSPNPLPIFDRRGGGVTRVSPIITDLWRRTQPMIRYRLGDVLTLDDDATLCPCGSGFRVIRTIEGRCDDVCTFPDASTGEPRRFYPDTIRRMILLADARITDYAAVQDASGNLTIHLDIGEGIDFAEVRDSVLRSAADILTQYGCCARRLEIGEGLPRTHAGAKRRRVISLVKDFDNSRFESPGSRSVK